MENINNNEPIVKNLKQKLTKKMVLIDLNQNIINFQCNFTVHSHGIPFQAVVVTQEQLDSDDFQVEYQNVVNGIIEAEIENISNVYNNYCLLLKSEQDCDVDIQINVVPLPETIKENFEEPVTENHPVHTPIDTPFYKTNTFAWIIIFVGVVLIIYLLFSDNKKGKTESDKIEIVKSPVPVMKSPVPVMKSPPSLLTKLKNTRI